MKPNKKLAYYFFLAILCTNLTGCGTIPSYEELGNGYVEATYTRTSFSEPSAHRIALQYRKGWHTVEIWPSLDGVKEVINGETVVFVGKAASKQPNPENSRATDSRLFAVRAPSLPLDITDEVLWRWSKQSGEDFATLLKKAYVSYPKETNNILELHFAIWSPPDWPDLNIHMDWNQISDIMREVKEKGVERKDPVWGTSYIEKEFKPETKSN